MPRTVRQRFALVLAGAERLVDSRRGAIVLFAVALVVFAFESIAWPLTSGRDLSTYMRVYVELFDADPLFPQAMLARTPGTPIVAGALLDAGGWLAEVVLGVLFAASIVAWTRAALTIGPRVALAVAVALLAYPSYGVLFHALSSDALFAAGFAGWALLVTRAVTHRSPAAFAAAGAGVAALALIRPGNQVLVVVALAAFLVPGALRARVAHAAVFVAAAVLPLAGWAAVNELRFDDFTVARGANVTVPLYRAFVTDRIVSPDNGPASRELADAVERELLPREPYRSYGVDLEEFFTSGSGRMHEDLIGLTDRVFGWDTDYAILGRVGREAVRSHLGRYVRGVARSFWQELHHPLFAARREGRSGGSDSGPQETIRVNRLRLPKPSEGDLIPAAHQSGFVSTPDGSAREVWTSPTEHAVVFDDPREARRYEAHRRRLDELLTSFPDRAGTAWLHERLNDLSRVYPRAWMFLLAGVVALGLRRPRSWRLPVILSAAAIVVLATTVIGVYAVPEYAVPLVPAFVLLTATGLFGARSAPIPSSTKAGATGSR